MASSGRPSSRRARRVESDRQRYLAHYGLDPWKPEHYDLVLDSTNASPEELVAQVLEPQVGVEAVGAANGQLDAAFGQVAIHRAFRISCKACIVGGLCNVVHGLH